MRCFSVLILLLLSVSILNGYYLGMLGEEPNWEELEVYQETYTRHEFEDVLSQVYLPYGYNENWIQVYPSFVDIRTNRHDPAGIFRLRFKEQPLFEENDLKVEPRKTPVVADPNQPLSGLIIALDPGHIGGDFSIMERRHFVIGDDAPVKEGDNALIVAGVLKKQLEVMGAEVHLVRNDLQPVTSQRPDALWFQAEAIEQQAWLDKNRGKGLKTPWEENAFKIKIDKRAEMLFYRVSEIQARAKLINEVIKPDFTVVIHFNVSSWPSGSVKGQRKLAKSNHLHVLVNGTYTDLELGLDDVRQQLFKKLLSRNHEIEIPLADAVAAGLSENTKLPAFTYRGKNASLQGETGLVWARNLLANRIYSGPVVYTEAYAANSEEAYMRLQAGDYEGTRQIAGQERVSLFSEYATGISEGIRRYYLQ